MYEERRYTGALFVILPNKLGVCSTCVIDMLEYNRKEHFPPWLVYFAYILIYSISFGLLPKNDGFFGVREFLFPSWSYFYIYNYSRNSKVQKTTTTPFGESKESVQFYYFCLYLDIHCTTTYIVNHIPTPIINSYEKDTC